MLRQLLRSFFGLEPTLDLHGLGVKAALAETAAFIERAAADGVSPVRIVYGKGHGSPGGVGVLRGVIPRWLEHDGAQWVERFERRLDGDGNDGAVIVWLRRPREL